jgi:hypothetical protein
MEVSRHVRFGRIFSLPVNLFKPHCDLVHGALAAVQNGLPITPGSGNVRRVIKYFGKHIVTNHAA